MVTQEIYRGCHKPRGSHQSGRQLTPTHKHKRQSTTMTQCHTLSPLWKADCEGYFWRVLKDCGPALRRWRKWLPTGRHCWQHHTHSSLLMLTHSHHLVSIWEASVSFAYIHINSLQLQTWHKLVIALSQHQKSLLQCYGNSQNQLFYDC